MPGFFYFYQKNEMKRFTASILLLAFIAIMASILSGCATTKDKAMKWLGEHPAESAAYCANTYPPRDSVGQAVTIVKADNKNYAGQIDTLSRVVDSLASKLADDSIKTAVGGRIAGQELSNYKTQVSALKKSIDALKRSYEPCKPEIQQVTVYRENTARVIELRLQLATLQDKYNALEFDKNEADDLAKKRLWGLIAAGVVLVVLAYKLLKK